MDTNPPAGSPDLNATRHEEPLEDKLPSETIAAAAAIGPQSPIRIRVNSGPPPSLGPPSSAQTASSPRHSLDGISHGKESLAPGYALSLEEAAALVRRERPGRYTFKRRIGKGAMGTVFLAYDANVEILVAIKLVPGDPRAMREGRALGRLKDQRIVTLLDMFPCGMHVAIVMEYVDGSTLDNAFESGELKRDYATLMRIAKEIAGALACLHTADVPVLHRDLKGANVLMTKNGAIRVLDFGLGVMRAPTSMVPEPLSPRPPPALAPMLTWGAAGTPSTMAPEQAFSPGDVGTHSDIFAFGAMLYDFATGTPPHNGADAHEVLRKKRTPVEPLWSRRPDLPEGFCGLIDACLTIDWRERIPKDGAELQAGLLEVEAEAVLASGGAHLALTSARAHAWRRPSKRKKTVFAGIAAALVALTGTIGVRVYHRSTDAAALAARGLDVNVHVKGAPVPTPDRVAVLGFVNATQISMLEADAAMAAERIAAAVELDGMLVLHRNDAVRGAIERKLVEARTRKDAPSLAALTTTGAQYSLLGTMKGDASRINAKIELVDMKTAATVASIEANAPESRFFELMDRVDGEVRRLLSLRALDAEGAKPIQRALPAEEEAAREYARALDLLGGGELRAARDKLITISGMGAKAHARTQVLIAELDHQLGAEDDAKKYAERARALARGLPEWERLPIEARADLAEGNATAAVAKLKSLGPTRRNVEAIDRLVQAAHEALKYDDGETALHELDVFGETFARDPHIAQAKAALAWARLDSESTLKYAREASALAGERIAVRAQAKRFEARALYFSSGATAEADAACDEAMDLLLAIDDTRDAASLYIARGDAKYDAMDFQGEIEDLKKGLQLKGVSESSIGNDFLERMTSAEWKLGNYEDAERMFQMLISKKDIGKIARGYAFLYASAGAREQGHFSEAATRLAKAKESLSDTNTGDLVVLLIEEAALERARGQLKSALALALRAFELASTEVKDFRAEAANALGWAYLDNHQIGKAQKLFTLAHEEARLHNSRMNQDEACKGIAKMPLQEGMVICKK